MIRVTATTPEAAPRPSRPKAGHGDERDTILSRMYEGFLGLPVPIVLGVMWLAGVALMGFFVLALCLLAWPSP